MRDALKIDKMARWVNADIHKDVTTVVDMTTSVPSQDAKGLITSLIASLLDVHMVMS